MHTFIGVCAVVAIILVCLVVYGCCRAASRSDDYWGIM